MYVSAERRGMGGGGVELVSLRTPKSLNHITGDIFSRCIPLLLSLLIYFLWAGASYCVRANYEAHVSYRFQFESNNAFTI
jgi:hypothetical protein